MTHLKKLKRAVKKREEEYLKIQGIYVAKTREVNKISEKYKIAADYMKKAKQELQEYIAMNETKIPLDKIT